MARILLLALVCGLAGAQQQKPPQQQTPPPQRPETAAEQPETVIPVTVQNVLVPTIVYDRDGSYVAGLQPSQFHLYDNGKEQNIHVDETFQPISMVIAIQSNSEVQSILPQVNRIGNLVGPLILGDQGEAAVIAFDSRVRTLQDFTSDPEKITQAVRKIYPGSTSSRMIDAVMEGTRMLRSRPQNRRRIIILISETRDVASETNGREALRYLQLSNVVVYPVEMSRLVGKLTAPPSVPRPDTNPPAQTPLPSGVAATPTNVEHTYGTGGNRIEFLPLLVEIYRDAKAVFKISPAELFAKGTGGTEYGFYRLHGLEDAVQKIGEELHAEYTISYSPNNKEEGGFHKLTVEVAAQNVGKILYRPGYWLGALK